MKVDYEVLEPVLSPFDAMKEDAPLVHASGNILAHEHLVRGNEMCIRDRAWAVRQR